MVDLDSVSPDTPDREVSAGLAGPRMHPADRPTCFASPTGYRRCVRLMYRVARGQYRRDAVYLGYEDLGGDAGEA